MIDGREGFASPVSHTSSLEGRLDDKNSIPLPSGVWGSGQLPTRTSVSGVSGRDYPGGVGQNGYLILDVQVINQYFKNYMAYIHILHPFLGARVLRDMIHLFKRRYSWDFVLLNSRNISTGKRKRDAEDSPNAFDQPSSSVTPRLQTRNLGQPIDIKHSITNTIVLLVIALGKMCAHKSPLPGYLQLPSVSTSTLSDNHFSDGFVTSVAASALTPAASAPSSSLQGRNSKISEAQATISSPVDLRGENMDVVPGFTYFAQGAGILRELPGGCSVSHVQANILAGLYMG